MRTWAWMMLLGCAVARPETPTPTETPPSTWCDGARTSPLLQVDDHAVGLVDDVRFVTTAEGLVRDASVPFGAPLVAAAESRGTWFFVASDGRVLTSASALGPTTSRATDVRLAAPAQRGALVGIRSDGRAIELTTDQSREVALPWPVTMVGAFEGGRFAILPGGALAIGPTLETLRVTSRPDAVERAWAEGDGLRVESLEGSFRVDARGRVADASPRCAPLRELVDARLRRVPWIRGVVTTDDGRRGWIEEDRFEVRSATERASWPWLWATHCELEAHETFYARCPAALHRLEASGWVEIARGDWFPHPHAWPGTCARADPEATTLCVRTPDGTRVEIPRPRVDGELLDVVHAIVCGAELFLGTPEATFVVSDARTLEGFEALGCVDGKLWGRRDEHLQVWRDGAFERRGWIGGDQGVLASNGRHAMFVASRVLTSRDGGRTWERLDRDATHATCAHDGCVALSFSGQIVARSDGLGEGTSVPQEPPRVGPAREIFLDDLRRTDQPSAPRWLCEDDATSSPPDRGLERAGLRFARDGLDLRRDGLRFSAPADAVGLLGLAVSSLDDDAHLVLWRTPRGAVARAFSRDATGRVERRFTSSELASPRAVVHEGRVAVQVGHLVYRVGSDDPAPQTLDLLDARGLAICASVNETAPRTLHSVVFDDRSARIEVDVEARCLATLSFDDFSFSPSIDTITVYEAFEGRLRDGPTSCRIVWSDSRAARVPSRTQREGVLIFDPEETSRCALEVVRLYDRPFLQSRFAVDLRSGTAVSTMDGSMSRGVLAFSEEGRHGCRVDSARVDDDVIATSEVSIAHEDVGRAVVRGGCSVRYRYEAVSSRRDVGVPLDYLRGVGRDGERCERGADEMTRLSSHETRPLERRLLRPWWILLLSSIGLFAIPLAADAPEVPSHLVGNYEDATGAGDACLSVRPTVVSYASLSHDSERGCGVDLRVVGVSAGEIRLLDGDRPVRMIVTEREIRFHRSARPTCAHLQPNQFRFLRSSRRAARECFE